MQWNICSDSDQITGIKRYEDELFKNMNNLIDVERIKRTHSKSYLEDMFKFKTNGADIVHATSQTLAPLKLFKNPKNFVLTIHDIALNHCTTSHKIKSIWYLLRYSIPKIDTIISDSLFTKKELIKHINIDKNKIHVVPLGVNENYKPINKNICKLKFNLDPDKKYILMISSIAAWKNMDLMNRIISECVDYIFIKAGYNENINNPKVINLGHIAEIDMPYLYNACDLFLHASLYEGFGLPVLEAMSCGCPIICSNSASLPEVVGEAGILLDAHVNDENINNFVENINNVLTDDDLRNCLSKQSIKQSNKFSWKRTAEETIEIYKKLI